MKYLISILLTLTFVILTVGVKAKETKNDRLTIQSNLYLSSDSSNGTRSFTVGDSVSQREEADRLNAERLRTEANNQRRKMGKRQEYRQMDRKPIY